MSRLQQERKFFASDRALCVEVYADPLDYRTGYERQQLLHRLVSAGADDHLMVLEHTPVYTRGRRNVAGNFLITPEALRAAGTDVVVTDRGGELTFHGPGQIVMYIISNLEERARHIRAFVELLEEVVIEYTGTRFGLATGRRKPYPGVWWGKEKIAAVGISIHNKTTMHGLSLNLSTDMSFFDAIVPCGIRDGGVCSLASIQQATGGDMPIFTMMAEKQNIARIFADLYGYNRIRFSPEL